MTPIDIIYLDEVDSTNNYLRSRCGELPDGTVVTARVQTAGRGRRGHGWAADEGMLPLSILLKNPPESETLTARTGLAVCGAIEEMFAAPPDIMIKWPNDVLVNGFKICGILCESVFVGGERNIIAGIGVNISQGAAFFRDAGLPHASSLKLLTGKDIDRAALLERIAAHVKRRAAVTFAECRDEYRRRLVNLGRDVRVISPDGERRAIAVDVSGNGFLVCRDGDEVFEVSSGEVSVRGENGYI